MLHLTTNSTISERGLDFRFPASHQDRPLGKGHYPPFPAETYDIIAIFPNQVRSTALSLGLRAQQRADEIALSANKVLDVHGAPAGQLHFLE